MAGSALVLLFGTVCLAGILGKVRNKLGETQDVGEQAGAFCCAMDRQLRTVESLLDTAAQDVLALAAGELEDDMDEGAAG